MTPPVYRSDNLRAPRQMTVGQALAFLVADLSADERRVYNRFRSNGYGRATALKRARVALPTPPLDAA